MIEGDDEMGTGQLVRNAVERHRYEISVDDELAGFTEYVDRDGQRVFYHTEIDDRFAGRGLATALISDALSDTRAEGKRIVPVCPFVAKYLRKHDEFADIADRVTREVLAEIRGLNQRQG